MLCVPALIFSASANGLAQKTQCDKDCVKTVRGLLKASYDGFSTGWLEKANSRLGDKVGAAIIKIYRGRALYKPDNIRTFLPVIQMAFRDTDMIENPQDKNPIVTASLLRRLQRRTKDHFLSMDITKTLNVVIFSDPQDVSSSVEKKQPR
jgi:hypothetical protein